MDQERLDLSVSDGLYGDPDHAGGPIAPGAAPAGR